MANKVGRRLHRKAIPPLAEPDTEPIKTPAKTPAPEKKVSVRKPKLGDRVKYYRAEGIIQPAVVVMVRNDFKVDLSVSINDKGGTEYIKIVSQSSKKEPGTWSW